MADDDIQFFGARRGWPLRRRFWALDSYGLLLLMILVSLLVASIGTATHQGLVGVVRSLVLSGTFLFALHTSGATKFMYIASIVLIVLAVAGSVILPTGTKTGDVFGAIAGLLLVLGGLFTIIRRFAENPVITGQTVLSALCVYLLLGLAYASVYGFIGAVDTSGLFGPQSGAGDSLIRMYFSFITLTTVGYGDFVPYSDPARMVAVTEALIGQVYLVTIVALLVSQIGHRRPRRDAT